MNTKQKRYLQSFGFLVIIMALVRCAFPTVAGVSDEKPVAVAETDTVETSEDSVVIAENDVAEQPVAAVATRFVDAEGNLVKHPIYSVARYKDAFPDSNSVQMAAAKRWGVPPVEDREEAEHRKLELVYVASSPYYHVERLKRSIPYLVPRAAQLLHDIGKPKSKRWDNAQGWTFHNHNFIGAKMVPQMFRRMKLPMDAKMKYVQKLVDMHMRPIVIADEQVTDSAVRRLMNDAGDDIDELMMLCEADITSKNSMRKARFMENFRIVREKLADLKEKDYKRELQPVIDGNEIMQMFSLKPSREVGTLKKALKDAVLDNRVPNEREALMALLMEKARQMGLCSNGNTIS